MTDRIDHAAEAQRLLHQWSREAMPVAQVHASLAIVEQLRIGNIIALGYGGDEADCDQARADARAALVNKASGGTDDVDNLQALCRACHKAKTQAESAAGGGGGDRVQGYSPS